MIQGVCVTQKQLYLSRNLTPNFRLSFLFFATHQVAASSVINNSVTITSACQFCQMFLASCFLLGRLIQCLDWHKLTVLLTCFMFMLQSAKCRQCESRAHWHSEPCYVVQCRNRAPCKCRSQRAQYLQYRLSPAGLDQCQLFAI